MAEVRGTTDLDSLHVHGDLTVDGDFAQGSAITLTGSLTVGAGLSVGSNTTITGTLTVAGAITGSSTLTINGSSQFNAAVAMSSTLSVTGNIVSTTILTGAGAAATPVIAANGGSSTGLFFAAGVTAFSSQGTESFRLSSLGVGVFANGITVGSNAAITGALSTTTSATVGTTFSVGSNATITGTLTPSGGIVGFGSSTAATTGQIGETISASTLRSVAGSMSTAATTNIIAAGLTLTPGRWEIVGHMGFLPGSLTSITNLEAAISLNSASYPATDTLAVPTSGAVRWKYSTAAQVPVTDMTAFVGRTTVNIAANTTYWLLAVATFSISTMNGYGSLVGTRIS